MSLYILPNEIFFSIFDFLDISSIKSFNLVSTLISILATDRIRHKYYYVNNKITNNEIKDKIRCLVAKSTDVVQEYPYIQKLYLSSE